MKTFIIINGAPGAGKSFKIDEQFKAINYFQIHEDITDPMFEMIDQFYTNPKDTYNSFALELAFIFQHAQKVFEAINIGKQNIVSHSGFKAHLKHTRAQVKFGYLTLEQMTYLNNIVMQLDETLELMLTEKGYVQKIINISVSDEDLINQIAARGRKNEINSPQFQNGYFEYLNYLFDLGVQA